MDFYMWRPQSHDRALGLRPRIDEKQPRDAVLHINKPVHSGEVQNIVHSEFALPSSAINALERRYVAVHESLGLRSEFISIQHPSSFHFFWFEHTSPFISCLHAARLAEISMGSQSQKGSLWANITYWFTKPVCLVLGMVKEAGRICVLMAKVY